MSDVRDWPSDGKGGFSISDTSLNNNIDTDGSDRPHTESRKASKDPVNGQYRCNGSQNNSVSNSVTTTGKETVFKAILTTLKSEKTSENEETGSQTGSSRPSHKVINDWWLVELGACLISAIAMIALIIVIRRHDGKPLPKWPLHITIATFVAVCSNIMKATLLVPVVCASRSLSSPFRTVSRIKSCPQST